MSLPSTITADVDTDTSGVFTTTGIAALSFTRLGDEGLNKSTYVETTNHSVISRDMLNFYSTPAKPSGNSCGIQRSAIKRTRDFSVDTRDGSGTHYLPARCQISFDLPVGMTDAQRRVFILESVAIAIRADGFAANTSHDCVERVTKWGEC